ncbi:MAG: ribosome-binding ATPase YchF (GTP1/OBG family), partial [Pseudohongiellaceae bacterium]
MTPAFAVVGHPNKGKSSIFAATLTNWQILLTGAHS